jgi:hypothetical protein
VGEVGEVEARGCLGRSLEVLRQPTESSHPRKASLADPPARHWDEAGLGLRQFHNVQRDPLLARHFIYITRFHMDDSSNSRDSVPIRVAGGVICLLAATAGIDGYLTTGVWRFEFRQNSFEGAVAAYLFVGYALLGGLCLASAWQHLRGHGRGAKQSSKPTPLRGFFQVLARNMKAATFFRVSIVVSIALAIVGAIIDAVLGLIPEELSRAYELVVPQGSRTKDVLLLLIGSTLFVAGIGSTVGLYLFRPWAPRVALCVSVAGLLIYPLIDVQIMSPWSQLLTEASFVLWGAVLAMAYLPPLAQRFRRSL